MSRFLADVRPPSRIMIAAVTLRSSSRKITEEEIVEYLVKKAQRKAAKVAKKLKAQKVSGYSNDSNPFGDSNLNEKFVWRKKIERDVSQGVPLEEFSVKAEKKRQRERMSKVFLVESVFQEKYFMAYYDGVIYTTIWMHFGLVNYILLAALVAREHALAEFQDWEKKEEEFHFDQRKLGSEIRLREGRVKPIDVLCKHLSGSDDLDIEINEPYMAFKGLTVKDMEELRDDIKMYLDLDRATPTHVEYWETIYLATFLEFGYFVISVLVTVRNFFIYRLSILLLLMRDSGCPLSTTRLSARSTLPRSESLIVNLLLQRFLRTQTVETERFLLAWDWKRLPRVVSHLIADEITKNLSKGKFTIFAVSVPVSPVKKFRHKSPHPCLSPTETLLQGKEKIVEIDDDELGFLPSLLTDPAFDPGIPLEPIRSSVGTSARRMSPLTTSTSGSNGEEGSSGSEDTLSENGEGDSGEVSPSGTSRPEERSTVGGRALSRDYAIDYMSCTTTFDELNDLWLRYSIPGEILLKIPGKNDTPSWPPRGYVTLFLKSFKHGLSEPTVDEVKHLYQLKSSPKDADWYYFQSSTKSRKPITDLPTGGGGTWKRKFFFVGGPWGQVAQMDGKDYRVPSRFAVPGCLLALDVLDKNKDTPTAKRANIVQQVSLLKTLPPAPTKVGETSGAVTDPASFSPLVGPRSRLPDSRAEHLVPYLNELSKLVSKKDLDDFDGCTLGELVGAMQYSAFHLSCMTTYCKANVGRYDMKMNEDIQSAMTRADDAEKKAGELNVENLKLIEQESFAQAKAITLEEELTKVKEDLQRQKAMYEAQLESLCDSHRAQVENLEKEADNQYDQGLRHSYRCIMAVLRKQHPELKMDDLAAGVT
ncbi:Cactin [Citrus sinensis]|nr:Cactin [Citrus sinensis]